MECPTWELASSSLPQSSSPTPSHDSWGVNEEGSPPRPPSQPELTTTEDQPGPPALLAPIIRGHLGSWEGVEPCREGVVPEQVNGHNL